MTFALVPTRRMDLTTFAHLSGLHPDLVVRLVDLGLLDAEPDSRGLLCFAPSQLNAAARLQRLRAGFALNYSALALVVELLDRISELEMALRKRTGTGGTTWT
jgi:chaperone modulatory protein CbpM